MSRSGLRFRLAPSGLHGLSARARDLVKHHQTQMSTRIPNLLLQSFVRGLSGRSGFRKNLRYGATLP